MVIKLGYNNKYREGYNTEGQKEVGNMSKRQNQVLQKYVNENI